MPLWRPLSCFIKLLLIGHFDNKYDWNVLVLADVAQLVAHPTCNRAVRGSSPLVGSLNETDVIGVTCGFNYRKKLT